MTAVVLGPAIEPVQPMSPGVELQNALHWLVRVTTSFGSEAVAREGYGLRWHAERRIVLTPKLIEGVCLELEVPSLSLQFHEGGEPSPHRLVLDDKSSAEIEAWLLVEMLHRGFDRDRFSKILPYRASALMGGEEPKYEAEEHRAELGAIADRFAGAARTLAAAAEALGAPRREDGSLTVWPEGFAIGFLTGAGDGASSRPVVRLSHVPDADGNGHSAFVAERLADEGTPSGRRTVDAGSATVDALVAMVREVEAASRQ